MTRTVPRLAEMPSDGDIDAIPLAFLGRTSTFDLQDPTISIPRQVGEVDAKKPDGSKIVAHFWDIESGGLPLEQRGRGHAHELFDIPVPRDGGIQDLLEEAARPDRRFAAVICSNIERSARESFYGIKLEKDLEALGVPLLAADEPIVFDRSDPNTILFRRMKQSIAEWYRLNAKKEAMSGMRTHVKQGWLLGRVPPGYLGDCVPHPVPAKRQLGLTKTRLVPDPERRDAIVRIFTWRVEERLGDEKVCNRLNADLIANPPPIGNTRWRVHVVRAIRQNPKYTGYMVWNRRGPKPKRALNPPSEWVWSPEPTHEALISKELYEKAQQVSELTWRSRQGSEPNRHPMTKRNYRFRSYVRCAICGRRMIGHVEHGVTGYRCGATVADPDRIMERFPDHPRYVFLREDILLQAVSDFLSDRVFGPRRRALLDHTFSEAAAREHAERDRRMANLRKGVEHATQVKRTLVREIEALPDDDDEAEVLRGDLRERYYEQERARRSLAEELAQLEAAQPPMPLEDPDLLDALPIMPVDLAEAPIEDLRALFDALALSIRFDRQRQELVIAVTLTDMLVDVTQPTNHAEGGEGAPLGAACPLLPWLSGLSV